MQAWTMTARSAAVGFPCVFVNAECLRVGRIARWNMADQDLMVAARRLSSRYGSVVALGLTGAFIIATMQAWTVAARTLPVGTPRRAVNCNCLCIGRIARRNMADRDLILVVACLTSLRRRLGCGNGTRHRLRDSEGSSDKQCHAAYDH